MFKRIGIVMATLIGTLTLLTGMALAQTATPAGTQIQNQASATYTDASGQPQVATSNLAVTVVQQVYALSITPNTTSATGAFGPTDPTNWTGVPAATNDKQSLAGSNENFGYTILNTGNGSDTYSLTVALDPANAGNPLAGVTAYVDLNGNGQVDAGEPTLTGWNAGTRTGTITVAAGATARVVVSANLPSAAAGSTFKLDLTGTSNGNGSVVDRNNLSRVTVVNDAILDLSKAATGPDAASQITYTIAGSNTGNQAARSRPAVVVITGTDAGTYNGVLISDTIPANTTFVAGSATGSSGAPLTRVVYSTATTGTAWTFDAPAAGSVRRVGLLMLPASPIASTTNTSTAAANQNGAVNTLPTSANYTMSFRVSVNAGTAAGTAITNTATVNYRLANGTTDATTTSNQTTSIAPTTRSVALGPVGFATGNPTAGGIPGYTDPVTGRSFTYTGSGTGATSGTTDAQAVASAPMNTTVSFVQSILNNGNANDVFNISLDASSNLPAGTTVSYFLSDGATPLSSGLALAAGASTNIVVKVILPSTTVPAGAPFNAVIRATSQNDATKSDITTDRITALTAGLGVTLVNNDTNSGTTPPAGTSSAPYIPSTNPGTSVNYPLYLTNTGANTDTFNLTATGSGLPAGSTVQFFLDANGDGLPDTGTPIANTGPVSAGAGLQLVAVITVPTGAAPQTGSAAGLPVVFTATSTDNSSFSGSQTNSLTVNAVNVIAFSPSRSGTVTSPGTLIYSHTLTNNGNSSITALQVAPSGGGAGFGYQVYQDVNGNGSIDAGDTLISPSSATTLGTAIAPGSSVTLLVEVTVAAGIPASTVDAKTLTATATFGTNGTANASLVDTTTVVAGNLVLSKSGTPGSVSPRAYLIPANFGQSEITYTIRVQNIGSAALSNVIVFDPVPQYTDFKFGSVNVTNCPADSTCTVEYSTDNGATWGTTAPADTNGNGYSDDAVRVTNIRVRITNATGNSFAPGSDVTITFIVSVR
jgi:uncharacterized repeat protein (TIGR01451 family)